jgi:hypothetical protein
MGALALKRLEEIEAELQMLKRELRNGKVVRLGGLWSGIKVSDEDLAAAENSLFGREV